jgi:hypothetical protein
MMKASPAITPAQMSKTAIQDLRGWNGGSRIGVRQVGHATRCRWTDPPQLGHRAIPSAFSAAIDGRNSPRD